MVAKHVQATSSAGGDSVPGNKYHTISFPPLVDQDGRNELGEREIAIAVMGITGAGKSYLIRETTGKTVVVGDGLEGCKTSCTPVLITHWSRIKNAKTFRYTEGRGRHHEVQ